MVGREFSRQFRSIVSSSAWHQRKRRKAQLRLLLSSPLFDPDWYLSTYPDVAAAGVDPAIHFLQEGWREGRDPSPLFATAAYLRANNDVARSGINPLIHFIEFGHFEGRATFGSRQADKVEHFADFNFPPAASVATFALPPDQAVSWRTSKELLGEDSSVVTVGATVAGIEPAPARRETWEQVVRTFDAFVAREEITHVPTFGVGRRPGLQDAWYVTSHLLRMRWGYEGEPFVVRAFQHDPTADCASVLVCEELISSNLDMIDLRLRQSFFPLLLIFTDPFGTILAAQILAFPSLCRGGDHYAETLCVGADEGAQSSDPIVLGGVLGDELFALRSGACCPRVRCLSVDLTGSSGSTSLFRSDFRTWIERIVRISVMPIPLPAETRASMYLSEAVAIRASRPMRVGGGELVLRHDMIPTIGALTGGHQAQAVEGNGIGPCKEQLTLLFSTDDPSEPVISVTAPPQLPPGLVTIKADLAGPKSGPHGNARPLRAGAVIVRARSVSDAELLIPVWDDYSALKEHRPAITWCMEVRAAEAGTFREAMRSLRLQDGGAGDHVVLIGDVSTLHRAYSQDLFGAAVTFERNVEAALGAVKTPTVGFAAPDIVLHDSRTANILSDLVTCETVLSASCVEVSVHEQGTSWQVSIIENGELNESAKQTAALRKRAIEQLWGCDFAVRKPSSSFWIARSDVARLWLKGEADHSRAKGFHIQSARTTCTVHGNKTPLRSGFLPPEPCAVTEVEWFFG